MWKEQIIRQNKKKNIKPIKKNKSISSTWINTRDVVLTNNNIKNKIKSICEDRNRHNSLINEDEQDNNVTNYFRNGLDTSEVSISEVKSMQQLITVNEQERTLKDNS